MAYSKQTWSSNEPITADKLNHIEDGIPTKTSQLTNDSGFLTSHQSIPVATTSVPGLMSADDKTKLDGIAAGASVTGVKGDSESSYRTGNVNITAANIGLENVENKSSETIRGELTKTNVTTALGYTPPTASDVNKYEVLVVSSNGGVSALPYTIENTAIETDMVCVKAELSNPAAQANDWTINTNNAGQAVISGSIRESTNITIYLMKSNL